MKFDKHGNGNGLDDLYVLPESPTERQYLQSYVNETKRSYEWTRGDVKGSEWYGKDFMILPFGQCLKMYIQELSDK